MIRNFFVSILVCKDGQKWILHRLTLLMKMSSPIPNPKTPLMQYYTQWTSNPWGKKEKGMWYHVLNVIKIAHFSANKTCTIKYVLLCNIIPKIINLKNLLPLQRLPYILWIFQSKSKKKLLIYRNNSNTFQGIWGFHRMNRRSKTISIINSLDFEYNFHVRNGLPLGKFQKLKK